jgi:hypothetical protein
VKHRITIELDDDKLSEIIEYAQLKHAGSGRLCSTVTMMSEVGNAFIDDEVLNLIYSKIRVAACRIADIKYLGIDQKES